MYYLLFFGDLAKHNFTNNVDKKSICQNYIERLQIFSISFYWATTSESIFENINLTKM